MSETEINEDEMKQRMRERYYEETGKELPDHVVENYDEFFKVGPSVEDLHEIQEKARLAERSYGTPDSYWVLGAVVLFLMGLSFVAGGAWFILSAYASATYGVGIMALVFASAGFILGAILS